MQVIIEKLGDDYILLEESGQTVESGFKTYKSAKRFAIENGYAIVDRFF